MFQSGHCSRRSTLLLVAIVLGIASPLRADDASAKLQTEFRERVLPFMKSNCFGCHGGEKTRGDIDLTKFPTTTEVANSFPQWEAVLEQLKSGEMPPKDAKSQPSREDRQLVVKWIESFRQFESHRNAGDPGPVLARRLSNLEYDFTIRDLTGADIRPAREFPVDPANGAGFDNSGESLVMSPALVTKYLAAARHVSNHLILKPNGFAFAPYPVLTDTDRDKYGVRRIVDFYKRQPTDLADYFRAAWMHRQAKGATLSATAEKYRVSPRYFEVVWKALTETKHEVGPMAAVQSMWNAIPASTSEADLKRTCEKLRDFVVQVRTRVKVEVRNLTVPSMNRGAQAVVLWKDREMARNRRQYGGNATKVKFDDLGLNPDLLAYLKVPESEPERARYESTFKAFCDVFPDAFYVSERGRVFLDPKEDRFNTGRLLSAGFHNQMGYFRDDQPLCELILDEEGRRELDTLWKEFEFASNVPARMHSGLIWFERSESGYLAGKEFDFARAEDKDVISEAKFKKFAELYLAKTQRSTKDETIIQAVKDHFAISEANIRWVEKARVDSEPTHLRALQDFAERAYRRRLTDAERTGIVAFYQALRTEDGASHEDAVRDTVVRVLMSPNFCFRVDQQGGIDKDHATARAPLTGEALASRLSYFLWSSMPDPALLELARKGELARPEVMRDQVRRMLRDSKSRGLAIQFGGNWLGFARFDEHNAVDRERFPKFDNDLREAMYEEPIRFLCDLIQQDRSILDVVNGRHTFVNRPLARHYGMPEPASPMDWSRVDNADAFGRGGVLPMAAFMTKNSPGLRTSPVKRGYWVVTKLLGERIPAPPPNVPELPADEKKLGKLTLRETLARHREDRGCAACHARFDSFGLAFEGLGPVGERRSVDLAGNTVDVQVTYPSGAAGHGVKGLKDYIRQQRHDDFVDNLCRKLLSYALGRGLLLSDDSTVAQMKRELAQNDFRFGRLIETIVSSPQFLTRRAVPEAKRE